MTTSTFLPRKSDSLTVRPWRSGTEKSGATRDSRNAPRNTGISPKLQTRVGRVGDLALGRSACANALRLKYSPLDHRLRDGNAEVGAARALRLQLELVDAREIARLHPQRFGRRRVAGADAVEA